jgi:hypothetical protein
MYAPNAGSELSSRAGVRLRGAVVMMMVAMMVRGKCRRGNRRKNQHNQGGVNQLLHAANVALRKEEWK